MLLLEGCDGGAQEGVLGCKGGGRTEPSHAAYVCRTSGLCWCWGENVEVWHSGRVSISITPWFLKEADKVFGFSCELLQS